MRPLIRQLQDLLDPVVTAMGYELVGVEYRPQGSGGGEGLLRVYIDQENGIDVEDCQQVSHQLSGLLDVEDPISGQYTLEVSSPGMDRPLFVAEHYQRFAGHNVRIQLGVPLDGRRKFTGLLRGMQGDEVVLDVDGTAWSIPLDQIEKARLVPEF